MSIFSTHLVRVVFLLALIFTTSNSYSLTWGLTCGVGGCAGTETYPTPPNDPSPDLNPTGLDYPDPEPDLPIVPTTPEEPPTTSPQEYADGVPIGQACAQACSPDSGSGPDSNGVCTCTDPDPEIGTYEAFVTIEEQCPTGYTFDINSSSVCINDDFSDDGQPKLADPPGGPDAGGGLDGATDPDNAPLGIAQPEPGVVTKPKSGSGYSGESIIAESDDGSIETIDIFIVNAEDPNGVPIDPVEIVIDKKYDVNDQLIETTTQLGFTQPIPDGSTIGVGTNFPFTYNNSLGSNSSGTGTTGGGTGSGNGSGSGSGSGDDTSGTDGEEDQGYQGPTAEEIGDEVSDSLFGESIDTGTRDEFEDATSEKQDAQQSFVNRLTTTKNNLTNHFSVTLASGATCVNPQFWTPTGITDINFCSYTWVLQALGAIVLLIATWNSIAILFGD